MHKSFIYFLFLFKYLFTYILCKSWEQKLQNIWKVIRIYFSVVCIFYLCEFFPFIDFVSCLRNVTVVLILCVHWFLWKAVYKLVWSAQATFAHAHSHSYMCILHMYEKATQRLNLRQNWSLRSWSCQKIHHITRRANLNLSKYMQNN